MNRIAPVFLEIFTSAAPPGQIEPGGLHATVPVTSHTSPDSSALKGRSELICCFPYTGTRTASATATATVAVGINPPFGTTDFGFPSPSDWAIERDPATANTV